MHWWSDTVSATLTNTHIPHGKIWERPAPPRQKPAINRHELARMWDAVIALLFACTWRHGNPPSRCPVSELRRNSGLQKCKAAVPSIRPTVFGDQLGTSTTDKATHLRRSRERIAVLPAQLGRYN